MPKAKRLIELLMTINTKKKFTVGELAREFDVSKRTILRDLQELSEAGLPLYSEVGANGGYQVLKERTLPPISFTESEAVSMFFAYQSLQYYTSLPFQDESISALKKFYNYLPSDVKDRINKIKNHITFWIPPRELSTPHLKELLQCAIDQHVVTILYDSQKEIAYREIQPIGIYSMNGMWYCPAFCFKAEEIRVFRVDRIKELSFSAKQKPKKEITKHTIHEYHQGLEEGRQQLPFVVRLTRNGVKRCETDPWLSNSIRVHPAGDWMIESHISISFISWAADFFISCGIDAKVERPDILIKQIKKKIRELANYYE